MFAICRKDGCWILRMSHSSIHRTTSMQFAEFFVGSVKGSVFCILIDCRNGGFRMNHAMFNEMMPSRRPHESFVSSLLHRCAQQLDSCRHLPNHFAPAFAKIPAINSTLLLSKYCYSASINLNLPAVLHGSSPGECESSFLFFVLFFFFLSC